MEEKLEKKKTKGENERNGRKNKRKWKGEETKKGKQNKNERIEDERKKRMLLVMKARRQEDTKKTDNETEYPPHFQRDSAT